MAKSNNQKAKILYLERLMYETGENRVISMQEILDYLQEKGIHAERKSIYDDMQVLRSFGMEVKYRRGKPGGYYLNRQEQELPAFVREHTAEAKKQMKLLCSNSAEKDVKQYFGDSASYKQKDLGYFTVVTDLLEGPQFYGWLTAMGKDVHILKPKKAVQSYREYLKTLVKEYKSV